MGPHLSQSPRPLGTRSRSAPSHRPPLLEPLEPRQFLSASPDLSAIPPIPPAGATNTLSLFLSASTTATSCGNPVTLVAHLLLNGPASPDGLRVDFIDQQQGNNTILASATVHNGAASFNWTPSSIGDHQITAELEPAQSLPLATSAPQQLTISPAATQTCLSQIGNFVTATLSSPLPASTGTVTFVQGRKTLATVPLASDGTATLPAELLRPGKHKIVAAYNGSTNLLPSTSSLLFVKIPHRQPSPTPAGGLPTTTTLTWLNPTDFAGTPLSTLRKSRYATETRARHFIILLPPGIHHLTL